jgi:hypothetical protein
MFFPDWTNSAVSQKHGNSAAQNSSRIGDLHHIIAKNTICKKYKVSLNIKIMKKNIFYYSHKLIA